MKTKFYSSLRWKFIFLVGISGFISIVLMFVLIQLVYIYKYTWPFREIADFIANSSIISFPLLMLIGAFIFLFIYFLFSQKSIKYLEEIVQALQEIAGGRLDTRISRRTSDELGELAENINAMAYRLKKSIEEERNAERTKNELVTSVSHDLRTPLTSILGYLDLITNDRYKDEVELRHYADIAYSKAQRLKKLIEDLFEFTKLNYEGIRLNPVRVNLGELLEQLTEEFVPILDEAGMEYRLMIPHEKIIILADGDMIVRVFENLITNAVRYGKEGKYVDIELARENDAAVVKVANYGDSIPENDLPHIFDRLYRVEKSRSEKTGGTGLGLAIARNIVELHKGRIFAYNRNGRVIFETRFMTLPQ